MVPPCSCCQRDPFILPCLLRRADSTSSLKARSEAGSPVPPAAAPHGTSYSGACHTLAQQQPAAAHSHTAETSAVSADLGAAVDDMDSKDSSRKLKRQLMMSGLVTAVGIALHNFPEGVAVFLAAQKSHAIGECTSSCACWHVALFHP